MGTLAFCARHEDAAMSLAPDRAGLPAGGETLFEPVATGAVAGAEVVRWRGGDAVAAHDELAVEEPCEIRVGGQSIAVIMRTPGADLDLVRGFLVTEGIVGRLDEVAAIEPDEDEQNVMLVRLLPNHPFSAERLRRNLYASSSCGLCGKASIKAVRVLAPPLAALPRVPARILTSLDPLLREAQALFQRTGALHAAALFDLQGQLHVVREDVGRHNAVDKAIGAALGAQSGDPGSRLDLATAILMVSGRASFEICQKALVAGIPALAAVSAPSSLAVDLARATGLLLVGFVRGEAMTVYSAPERVAG
jgi:FdhD protein